MKASAPMRKVLEKLGNPNYIEELLETLSPSEISTLLLGISREMTEKISPGELLKKYGANRFAAPMNLDPIKAKKAELTMLETAEDLGFIPLLLSPAAPLGSCSVPGKVDQNNVVSAGRGLEIAADNTNSMALYIADGIKGGRLSNTPRSLNYCASSHVVRGQLFGSSTAVPHFLLFSMVTSGRDTGSYGFEQEALVRHVGFYQAFLTEGREEDIQVVLQARAGYKDSEGLVRRMRDCLKEAYPGLDIAISEEASSVAYYQGLNYKIRAGESDVADGGFVDWTQQFLSSKKERLLISGIGVNKWV